MKAFSGKKYGNERKETKRSGAWMFPLVVAAIYLVILAVRPGKAVLAINSSIRVMLQIAIPLSVAFVMMMLVNLFVDPVSLARVFGKGAGIKGIAFSTLAGMLSMGPIYAWYPFLLSLKKQGVSDFHIANFLCCRAVKPFLFPVMIYYFGWLYTGVFNSFIIIGALITASFVVL